MSAPSDPSGCTGFLGLMIDTGIARRKAPQELVPLALHARQFDDQPSNSNRISYDSAREHAQRQRPTATHSMALNQVTAVAVWLNVDPPPIR